MLISQYFSDLKGALIDTAVFAFVSNAATLLLALFCDSFYGIGFVIGGMLFCVVSCINLFGYLKKLKYNVLSRPADVFVRTQGIFYGFGGQTRSESSARAGGASAGR